MMKFILIKPGNYVRHYNYGHLITLFLKIYLFFSKCQEGGNILLINKILKVETSPPYVHDFIKSTVFSVKFV